MSKVYNKKSAMCYIFGLSPWLIWLSFDGSFTIQSLVPLIVIALVAWFIKGRGKAKLRLEDKLLLLFTATITFSTLVNIIIGPQYFSSYPLIGILYFFVIFLWFFTTTSHEHSQSEVKFIIYSYILLATTCSVWSVLQSMTGVSGKIEFVNLIGVAIDENYSSAIISIAPLYSLWLLLSKQMSTNIGSRILLLASLFINIAGVAVIGSRASILAMIISVVIYIAITTFHKPTLISVARGFLTALVIFIAGYITFLSIPSWTYDRYFTSSYEDKSNEQRLEIWNNGIQGVIDNALIGYGFGTFHRTPKSEAIGVPQSAPGHNTFLDIALYGGVVGIVLFLSVVFVIIRKLVKNRQIEIVLPAIACMGIICFVVGADRSVFLWNNLIILAIISNSSLTYHSTNTVKGARNNTITYNDVKVLNTIKEHR